MKAGESDKPVHDQGKKACFTATSWTVVITAQKQNSPDAQEALAQLCDRYWYPLYAYARRRGYDPHSAEDLTQEFFYRLLKENYLGVVDREKGKFRSFLLCSMMHFLSNQRARAQAQKRGGHYTLVSMDEEVAEERYLKESIADPSATKVFEHGWASTVLEQVRRQLKEEYDSAGKSELFGVLKDLVKEESVSGDYPEMAARLGMKPGAVAVAVHRMRQRYGELLRGAVSETLADPTPSTVEEEMRHLLSALSA